jgi:predicted nuclease of predicted toxin-antitoxin system
VRFYLDHNVDARCRKVLIDLGHDAWTTDEARREDASDEDQTTYAVQKGAVLVTHDSEFTQRRKSRPLGQHLRLKCHEFDAPELLRARLVECLPLLERHADITIELGHDRLYPWFGTEPD